MSVFDPMVQGLTFCQSTLAPASNPSLYIDLMVQLMRKRKEKKLHHCYYRGWWRNSNQTAQQTKDGTCRDFFSLRISEISNFDQTSSHKLVETKYRLILFRCWFNCTNKLNSVLICKQMFPFVQDCIVNFRWWGTQMEANETKLVFHRKNYIV